MALPQCLCRHWWCQSVGYWFLGDVLPHTSSPGNWHKPASVAALWIFSDTTDGDYGSKTTWSFLETFFPPPQASNLDGPRPPHFAKAAPPGRSTSRRSWNMVSCSVGHKKVDPLRCARWCTALCPHLGMMPYLRSITRLCLLYSLKWHAQTPRLEKSGNVKIERIECCMEGNIDMLLQS